MLCFTIQFENRTADAVWNRIGMQRKTAKSLSGNSVLSSSSPQTTTLSPTLHSSQSASANPIKPRSQQKSVKKQPQTVTRSKTVIVKERKQGKEYVIESNIHPERIEQRHRTAPVLKNRRIINRRRRPKKRRRKKAKPLKNFGVMTWN